MSRHAKSWIMRPKKDSLREGHLVLCTDHSKHFLVVDDWERAERADTDECWHCAEFYEFGGPKPCHSPGTIKLMVQLATKKALDKLEQAEEWINKAQEWLKTPAD